jgi:hypothetical protein
MSVGVQEWLAAINDMSVCAYHLFQLENDESSFPSHARHFIEHQLEQKNLAWQQFSSGETNVFHHCSSEVSTALMEKRKELEEDFLALVQERHKLLVVVRELEFTLSAELEKPEELQNTSHIVALIKMIKDKLVSDLETPKAKQLVVGAHDRYKAKLCNLIGQLDGLLAATG